MGKYCHVVLPDQILALIERVNVFTWGEFLNSPIFSNWLQPVISGERFENNDDLQIAAKLCSKLPGLISDDEGYTCYQWTVLEASHPGRFLHMRSLKQKIMQVRYTPRGKSLENSF